MSNIKNLQTASNSSVTLHKPFIGSDVRPGEQIFAFLEIPGDDNSTSLKLPVWRISPLGVELVIHSDEAPSMLVLQVGAQIDLTLVLAEQATVFKGLVVTTSFTEKDQRILGVRLVNNDMTGPSDTEKRRSRRWLTSDQFLPTAVSVNPYRFNDFIYFTVVDVSLEGFTLRTSLRNKFLIKGMRVDCMMNFPMIGEVSVRIEIQNARINTVNGKDYLTVGARIVNYSPELRELIGQYVMQFGPKVSVKELEAEGFFVQNLSKVLSFHTVRSKEDFDSVLELRRISYLQAGKISADTKKEEMTDIYDSRARILMLTIKGELVASVRLIFNDLLNKSEQEQFLPWPDTFPRRDEVVEITRACTHPDYRGKDLLIEMFKHVALTTVQSKRRWIVICATDHMAPLYQKMGFEKTNYNYLHTKLGNLKHHIMIADVPKALCGNKMSPLYWNAIWADVSKYMRNYDLIEVKGYDSVRMGLYRAVAPLSRFIRKQYLKRKVTKHLPISLPKIVPTIEKKAA